MADLLVAAAVDLGGGRWFADSVPRMAASLTLGKAGAVRQAVTGGAWLGARALGAASPGRTSRPRPWSPPLQEDGSVTLIAGAIYDRKSLARRLGVPPTDDPARLYAAAHAKLGNDCDRAIVGDYAVIQWFAHERRLRLARSPTGQMPLHYAVDGDRIVAGSTPRTLFAAGVSDALNDARIADTLLLNMRNDATGWYGAVRRVPAGAAVTIARGECREHRFWSIDSVSAVRFKTDREYVDAVDAAMRAAVRATTADFRQPGLSLSGGFDSQAIASYVAEQLPAGGRLRTYTSRPMAGWRTRHTESLWGDEGPEVAALCRMVPALDPTYIEAADARLTDRVEALALLGAVAPFNQSNMHWIHAATAAAADDGCDVLLTADAGNAGFSYDGLTGYPTWLRQGRWLRLLRELRASREPISMARRFMRFALYPNLPKRIELDLRGRKGWPGQPMESWSSLNPAWAEADAALHRAQGQGVDLQFLSSRDARGARGRMLDVLASDGPDIELGMTLLHGIPSRDPTAYRPLLELCIGIPDDQYLRGGIDRWLGRRLLKGRVPDCVVDKERRAVQAADWPLRFARERDALLAEIATLAQDARLSQILDFERMAARLRTWDPASVVGGTPAVNLPLLIGRGLQTARFVRFVEGRNAG